MTVAASLTSPRIQPRRGSAIALPSPLRVVIQQPCLTRYRVPVFKELAARPGIDLTVAYGEEAGLPNAAPDGFKGLYVPLRDYQFRGSVLRWHDAQLQFCRREHADVVVLSWSTRYLTLLPGLVRARWNGVGTVLWGHGYSKQETTLRETARARLALLADALVFYNRSTAHQYATAGWCPSDRTFVALNTLDLAPISAARDAWLAPGRLEAFRREQALEGKRPILFVSRLLESNRVDLLIRALADVRARVPEAVAIIVGGGPDEGRLRKIADDTGVADAVRFVGAIYGEDNIAPWFLAADAFCYPANIGLSLLHAFGYGCPVVTCDKVESQNPEIEALRHGENGLLYKDGNLEALTQALISLLSSQDLRRKLGAEALRTAGEEFTLRRMVDGFEASVRYAYVSRRRL